MSTNDKWWTFAMFGCFLMAIGLMIASIPLAMYCGDIAAVVAVLGAGGWGLVIVALSKWAQMEVSLWAAFRNAQMQADCYQLRAQAAENKLAELRGESKNE